MLIVSYWVGVRTVEPGTGYNASCTCTDQLGAESTYAGDTGNGAALTAITGLFIKQHGAGQPFNFVIDYFGTGTLAYDYDIYITPAPGAP